MTPKITDEMRRALKQHPEQPLTLEDEETNAHYVLMPVDLYKKVQSLIYDDSDPDVQEFLPHAHKAFKKDWDAPGMPAYENYNPTES